MLKPIQAFGRCRTHSHSHMNIFSLSLRKRLPLAHPITCMFCNTVKRLVVSRHVEVDVNVIHLAMYGYKHFTRDRTITSGNALRDPEPPTQLVPYPCDVILANPLSLTANIFICANVFMYI